MGYTLYVDNAGSYHVAQLIKGGWAVCPNVDHPEIDSVEGARVALVADLRSLITAETTLADWAGTQTGEDALFHLDQIDGFVADGVPGYHLLVDEGMWVYPLRPSESEGAPWVLRDMLTDAGALLTPPTKED